MILRAGKVGPVQPSHSDSSGKEIAAVEAERVMARGPGRRVLRNGTFYERMIKRGERWNTW